MFKKLVSSLLIITTFTGPMQPLLAMDNDSNNSLYERLVDPDDNHDLNRRPVGSDDSDTIISLEDRSEMSNDGTPKDPSAAMAKKNSTVQRGAPTTLDMLQGPQSNAQRPQSSAVLALDDNYVHIDDHDKFIKLKSYLAQNGVDAKTFLKVLTVVPLIAFEISHRGVQLTAKGLNLFLKGVGIPLTIEQTVAILKVIFFLSTLAATSLVAIYEFGKDLSLDAGLVNTSSYAVYEASTSSYLETLLEGVFKVSSGPFGSVTKDFNIKIPIGPTNISVSQDFSAPIPESTLISLPIGEWLQKNLSGITPGVIGYNAAVISVLSFCYFLEKFAAWEERPQPIREQIYKTIEKYTKQDQQERTGCLADIIKALKHPAAQTIHLGIFMVAANVLLASVIFQGLSANDVDKIANFTTPPGNYTGFNESSFSQGSSVSGDPLSFKVNVSGSTINDMYTNGYLEGLAYFMLDGVKSFNWAFPVSVFMSVVIAECFFVRLLQLM